MENLWNSMVDIMNNHPDENVIKKADTLLGQYNTAGGRKIKGELEYFINKHQKKVTK